MNEWEDGASSAAREAFRAECGRLTEILAGLDGNLLDRPTGCPPWAVRDLVAHVLTGAGRLTGMLAAEPPPRAEVDAAAYFGAAKFTPGVDHERVAAARREAATLPAGPALAAEFDQTWRAVYDAVGAVPPGRVVRTRHGDAMAVGEFLVTRVVEVAVHGLDLAAALHRPVWLTGAAAEVVARLLVGDAVVPAGLDWDRRTLIAKATGRAPLTDVERSTLERSGFRWLSFG
ncbi:maleylpyruvate isomerase N-terminal domain-containing protein [Micromonospora sp. CPCC 206060]|uniref:maleylpyruvate isomerase N-terminal domain-containing protein n=1 Tax=Micromonospora sp. CPCC 206060 TaxID=3122406 RepID=UPI002FF1323F